MSLTLEQRRLRQNYRDARDRCVKENHRLYPYYGGRGIEFKFENFEEFYEALGDKPCKGMSIDRVDNNGHYEKGNVRWATHSEQMLNRRNYEKQWLVGNANAVKRYLVTHPSGVQEVIENAAEFCRKHGLTKSNLQATASPKRPHVKTHRGYKLEYI